MVSVKRWAAAFAVAGMISMAGCAGDGIANDASAAAKAATIQVTITAADGPHKFNVETARTPEEQEHGLMFRTDIPLDGGMLFYPYPADGGPPREAGFWMKNTPSALDIIFIRADGTIARIADNTVPFSQETVRSGEPVAAVLELRGGRTADLGIGPGDTVDWPGRKK